LEAANKELEAFSYSVSHDLKAPLRAINGFGKLLKEEYGSKVDAEGKRLLDVIIINSAKMGNLINDLLEFSRASRTEIKEQHIDMEKTVTTVINELLEINNRKREEIKINSLPSILGDYNLIKQVWYNLISNALKFTSKISNPEIEIGFLVDGAKRIYFIKDNGAGFNQQYANKLFGVFQRLHMESDFEGTGAGLAIVKRIIQRHGGQIWAVGEVNKGATFYFSIPIKEAKNG
jgi:light-regulated signal transduction histidine kinase (bacteriophytochrome)